MSDDVDDPFAEEDAAYEERVRLWREAEERKWASRKGLVKVGARPQREVTQGFRRSHPSARDAARLFELVEAGLGERAVLSTLGPRPPSRARSCATPSNGSGSCPAAVRGDDDHRRGHPRVVRRRPRAVHARPVREAAAPSAAVDIPPRRAGAGGRARRATREPRRRAAARGRGQRARVRARDPARDP